MDCKAESIEKKLRIMMQMSLVLTWGARVPTVRMGRMVSFYFILEKKKQKKTTHTHTHTHSYLDDSAC